MESMDYRILNYRISSKFTTYEKFGTDEKVGAIQKEWMIQF